MRGEMLIEKRKKKRKLPIMTQRIEKLREKEMKGVGVMKRGPIVKRDNYQVTDQIFLMTHLLFETGRQWLRRCATNRKVAGSIPACVIGIFH